MYHAKSFLLKNTSSSKDSLGANIKPKRKRIKPILFIVPAAIIVIAAIIAITGVSRSPVRQFRLSFKELMEEKEDYCILDGAHTFFHIHTDSSEQGETVSEIKLNASSDGTHLSPMTASFLNRWTVLRNTKKSDGKTLTELWGNYNGKKDKICDIYSDDDLMSFKLLGLKDDFTFYSGSQLTPEQQKDRDYFIEKIGGILLGKGRIKTITSESGAFQIIPDGESEPVKCRMTALKVTGAELPMILSDISELILNDENLFSFYNKITFNNEEKSREKLENLKFKKIIGENDIYQLAFYRKGSRLLGASLSLSSDKLNNSLQLALTIRKRGNGYERKIWCSVKDFSILISSQSGTSDIQYEDAGNIILTDHRSDKMLNLEYTLTHTSENGGKIDSDYIQDNIIIKSTDEKMPYSLSIENKRRDEGYENYDLSTAESYITFDREDITFVLEISTSLNGSSTPEIKNYDIINGIMDETGTFNNELFVQKCKDALNALWESDLYKDISEQITVPKKTVIDAVTDFLELFTDEEVTLNNPDEEQPPAEEPTEYVYVPPAENPDGKQEYKTWEEITEDPQYSKELWDRFWGFYLSDDGMASKRFDNIIDYFYDFLEKYY